MALVATTPASPFPTTVDEESFGIIPLRDAHVLMVCHRAGHWSFPKGHPEEGERPRKTAERELLEEVGLQVAHYHLSPPLVEEYTYSGRHKRVTYWLAEVSGDVHVEAGELTEARWVPVGEATKLATFPEAKRLCREVEEILQ